ncbi:MAG TPA: amylo-alpha-1,6-glucosidase [Burkholderiales bacterium]
MPDPVRRYRRPEAGWDAQELLGREWLVTNGLGGYASSTLACLDTRSYHGLLTAALPAPLGRTLLLKQLSERLYADRGREVLLTEGAVGAEPPDAEGLQPLAEFRMEWGLPVWRFDAGAARLEKRVLMPHQQNTVYCLYRLLESSAPAQLMLRPWVHFRAHDNPAVAEPIGEYTLRVRGNCYEIVGDRRFAVLRLLFHGDDVRFVIDGGARKEVFLRAEAERGYAAYGSLWSPGYFVLDMTPGSRAALAASAEDWSSLMALDPEEVERYEYERRRRLLALADPRLRGAASELVLAADQFVVSPAGRVRDAIHAHATGDSVRSVVAGYHWFSDWGRDTMISIEGLTLATGRHAEAGWILRTFRHYVNDGLIPNLFPEGRNEGLYHSADATLWFLHAIDRYVEATGDRVTLALMLPTAREIVARHLQGTRFGIGVDPSDGLLRQGAEGYQLTWMDAKVENWVVTPRRGKAVEINALWYNALRLLAEWERRAHDDGAAARYAGAADRVRHAFNARFWYADGGYLYDVVDGEQGNDTACRPNQLFALSLPHPVLARERWPAVLEVVRTRLLTPVGLRTLAPGHPDYKSRYFGDLRARDAAYHQGTVWAWLIGPYVDAWLALHPEDRAGARARLEGLLPQLDEACVGSISEVFDAEPPFTPRGCISQAWSVAELLRCWVKTAAEA